MYSEKPSTQSTIKRWTVVLHLLNAVLMTSSLTIQQKFIYEEQSLVGLLLDIREKEARVEENLLKLYSRQLAGIVTRSCELLTIALLRSWITSSVLLIEELKIKHNGLKYLFMGLTGTTMKSLSCTPLLIPNRSGSLLWYRNSATHVKALIHFGAPLKSFITDCCVLCHIIWEDFDCKPSRSAESGRRFKGYRTQ